jgi:hypothetical protein
VTLEADPGPTGEPSERGLVLLTAQRDGDLAGEWLDALLDAGVDAELHIEDAARFNLTSTAYPVGVPFVYALFVPRGARDLAADTLIDLGWDGRGAPRASAMRASGRHLRNVLIVAGLSLALVAVLIVVRGG